MCEGDRGARGAAEGCMQIAEFESKWMGAVMIDEFVTRQMENVCV